MRPKSWMIFFLALLSGTLAGSMAFVYQQNAPKEKVVIRDVPTVDVAVAKVDMRVGMVLSDTSVRIVKWPVSAVPEGATGDVKSLVGSSVIAPIARGEPITPSRIAEQAAGPGVLAMIPNGMRAITLGVTETASTFINPGMHVDIIGSMGNGHTRIIMQNVRVLAVGHAIQPPDPKGKGVVKASPSNLITVLVTPSEAEELALASQKTTIQLALRNNTDDGLMRTPGARVANLFSDDVPEAPKPRPVARAVPAAPKEEKPKPDVVDLFRREKKSTVTLKPGS